SAYRRAFWHADQGALGSCGDKAHRTRRRSLPREYFLLHPRVGTVDILLEKLGTSVRHLEVIHKVLRKNSATYSRQCKKIETQGLEPFARQLYPAGKVGRRLQRQMV